MVQNIHAAAAQHEHDRFQVFRVAADIGIDFNQIICR